MPKQIWKIDEFHGGINDNADPRDILNNELAVSENVAVNELGKMRMLGGTSNAHSILNAATANLDADVTPGYGLFTFSHDFSGAEGGTPSESKTSYIAIADVNDTTAGADSMVDVSIEGSNFGVNQIKTKKTGSNSDINASIDFYNVDGALRICDTDWQDDNAPHIYKYLGDPNRTDDSGNLEMMEAAYAGCTINSDWYDIIGVKTEKPSSSTFDSDEVQATADNEQVETGSSGAPLLILTSATTANADVTPGTLTGGDAGTQVTNLERVIVDVTVTSESESTNDGQWRYKLILYRLDGTGPSTLLTRTMTVQAGRGPTTRQHVISVDDDGDAVAVGASHSWRLSLVVEQIDDVIMDIRVNSATYADGGSDYVSHVGVLSNAVPGFHVALNQPGTAPDEGFGWGADWQVGMSLIYDGNQESLITTCGQKDSPETKSFNYSSANGGKSPDICIFCQYDSGDVDSGTWNKRITGAVMYMKRLNDKKWYPQVEMDFVKGKATALFSGVERPVINQNFSSDRIYLFQIKSLDVLEPQLAITYESRTGISHDEKSIHSLWKTSCVANRRVYIGNVKTFFEDGSTKSFPDKMMRSLPNKFDIFPISESVDVAIHDGESIIALMEYNDRILQFKEKSLYIINASQDVEFLEDKLEYRGISHKSSVFKTEYGIVWANKNGCYHYDGQRVHDLLLKDGRPLIKQTTWESFIGQPLVGYNARQKQIIVVRDSRKSFTLTGTIDPAASTTVTGVGTKFLSEVYVGDSITVTEETKVVASIESDTSLTLTSAFSDNSNDTSPDCTPAGDAYIYDMITKSWTKGVGVFSQTNKTNFAVDSDGKLILHTHDGSSTSALVEWNDKASQTLPKIITKDIDFGSPSQKKSVKKVYMSYKGDGSAVTVLYGKDGIIPSSNFYRTGADGSSTNATDSTTPLHSSTVGTDDWVCAELKPVAGSITCNSFRIGIDGTAGTDFEINDISIVYRPKSVK